MNSNPTRYWTTAAFALSIFILAGCDKAPTREGSSNHQATKSTANNSDKPDTTDQTSDSPKTSGQADTTPPATPVDSPKQNEPGKPAEPEVPERVEPTVKGPSWQPIGSNVYNFGTIWVDTVVDHDFKFRNVGDEPLEIVRPPKAHCSCSTAPNYTKIVQPGEIGIVHYNLTTKNSEGTLTRDMEIYFNDPLKPKWTLYMTGYIKHVCSMEVIADGRITDPSNTAALQDVSGKKANFEEIQPNETLFRIIRLVNTSEHSPLELTMLPMTGDRYTASLAEKTPGEVWELTIVGSPPYQVGYNNGVIRFKTNVPDRPNWAIPIYARLPERIEVVPSRIVANMTQATAKTRPITIKNHGNTPLKVTAVAATNPDYRVTLLPNDPAKPNESVVEVVLPAGNYEPPAYGEMIRIETTDPEKSVIEIPVLPSFRGPTPRPDDKPMQFYPGKLLN